MVVPNQLPATGKGGAFGRSARRGIIQTSWMARPSRIQPKWISPAPSWRAPSAACAMIFVSQSLDDAGREHVTHPVQREADEDLGALLRALRRIALVLVQMRHQFLLPGNACAPCAFTDALYGSDRARRLPNRLRTRRRGRFSGNRFR